MWPMDCIYVTPFVEIKIPLVLLPQIDKIEEMPITLVYLYGPTGCGKTRMLQSIFAGHESYDTCGTVFPDKRVGCGKNFMIVDDFCGSETEHVKRYLKSIEWAIPKGDYFAILCGNEQPDDINIHMDHIFWCGAEHTMKEAREFLESILP